MTATASDFWLKNNDKLVTLVRRYLVRGRMPASGWEAIGKELGKTPTACRIHWTELKTAGKVEKPELVDDTPDPVQVEQERQESLRKMREERDLLTAIAGEKSLRAFLESLATNTAKKFQAPPPYKSQPPRKTETHESLVILFSDWHAPELISKDGTRGFNEYNRVIASQRAKRVVDSALSIKHRLETSGWRFGELVVALNGDMVPGTIHEAERHTDSANIVCSVYGTAWILAQALRDLAAQFPAVRVECVSGNHGRLPDAKRMQQKDPLRNWDTLVYLFARSFLNGVANIEWDIPNSYSVLYDVQGWTFGQMHGHDIKGWAGIPFYGIERSTRNQNALEASRQKTIHYWLISHFHSQSALPQASGEVFVNGSLCGGTEYSVNGIGKSDRPNQLMFGVHPEHGVTHRWPLYADTEEDAPAYDLGGWTLSV